MNKDILIILAFVLGLYLDSRLQAIIKKRELGFADAFCKDCNKLIQSPVGIMRYTEDGQALRIERAYCPSCKKIWNYFSEIAEEGEIKEHENTQFVYRKGNYERGSGDRGGVDK